MFLKIEKINIFKFICAAAIIFTIFGANLALAQPADDETPSDTTAADTIHGGLNEAAEVAGIPQEGESSIPVRIGNIISYALGFVGVIFLILMIAGGLLWMTAAGNEERVTKAKSLITNAVIGMVIVFSAYAITYFVTNTLLGD
ncbi:MAG: hypothetical protein WC348_03470 [Patescibacteria group bacterium]|jgi:hypothetical protein